MPRISAPTVAAHRAAQRAALLGAAATIVTEEGVDAVKPATVTARAGLARSSFYEYFSSREDILVAITVDAFEDWARDLEAQLAGVEPGLPRLRRFIEATMEMSADGKHDLATVLQQAEISPQRMEDIMALHDSVLLPLMSVLRDVGVQDLRATVPLINGILGAAVKQVSEGADAASVAASVYLMLTEGVLPR
ncbi:TetR/AcrR family transcriptional regulator [Microbacterium hominis]|uniref:TetR/AcrR family transcriptional regulator n=1 Tax=Microbacterium hominis TaxID=162426 RepID=A0A7D4TQ49_9MICO|nr:TetR/AcrR family transcriptional regulator [Microbacterium hominis]QKJ20962.1 TetR/AcrR family transcriptional regulator [Microbacterium hominis]